VYRIFSSSYLVFSCHLGPYNFITSKHLLFLHASQTIKIEFSRLLPSLKHFQRFSCDMQLIPIIHLFLLHIYSFYFITASISCFLEFVTLFPSFKGGVSSISLRLQRSIIEYLPRGMTCSICGLMLR
jgi:hypothetical protein